MWGLWSPRPDDARLQEWPFDFEDLNDRFAKQERVMGSRNRFRFPAGKSRPAVPSTIVPPQIQQWHRATTNALNEILAGRSPKQFPPLDLSIGTEFQQSVWRAMIRIKLGQTQSYGEIAASIG